MKNIKGPREDFRDNENTATQDSANQMSPSVPESVTAFHRASGVKSEAGPPLEELRSRWNNIQTSFVDEPRQAVYDADKLVASAITQITAALHQECSAMQKQWADGADVSTEDLRLSLQKYRMFFTRLMSMTM
jgi:ElaB/YqjD/DUF883 family membrane-anchored ribosome-binding protein